MIIKSAEFVTSAVNPSQYPQESLPEIAFVGRSNVGKSSLINTLVHRKHLVKTSSTPGRTQLVNFFDINRSFTFVDLPGYGYAKVPAAIQKKWAPMIETYLSGRKTLKGAVVILDIRRTPGQTELELLAWLAHYHIPGPLVLTKADKFSRGRQAVRHREIAETLGVDKDRLLLFSAKTGQGKERVWEIIEPLVSGDVTPIHATTSGMVAP
ncbi:MAG: ribosome biogenesis GTP-binding protein YihA/YsxC [Thermodesulfobacteriota bacterium]